MGEDQKASPTASWYFRSECHGSPHGQDVVGTAGRGRLLSSAPDPPITPSDRACGREPDDCSSQTCEGSLFCKPPVQSPPHSAQRCAHRRVGGASGCHCLPLGAWRGGTAGRRARGQTVVHGSFSTATRSCCAARRGSAPRPTHAPTAHCLSWWVQLEAPPPAGCAAAGTAVPPPFPSVVLSLAVPPPPPSPCARAIGSLDRAVAQRRCGVCQVAAAAMLCATVVGAAKQACLQGGGGCHAGGQHASRWQCAAVCRRPGFPGRGVDVRRGPGEAQRPPGGRRPLPAQRGARGEQCRRLAPHPRVPPADGWRGGGRGGRSGRSGATRPFSPPPRPPPWPRTDRSWDAAGRGAARPWRAAPSATESAPRRPPPPYERLWWRG